MGWAASVSSSLSQDMVFPTHFTVILENCRHEQKENCVSPRPPKELSCKYKISRYRR
jgi:hypothetical protein